MRIYATFIACITVAATLGSSCWADIVVYDNGAGGSSGIDNGIVSDPDFPSLQADDFVLASTEFITSLSWTGAYAFDNTPPAIDNFTISFYLDDGAGSPGVLQSSFNVGAVSRVDSGSDLFGFDIFEYSSSISGQNITGGQTYWVTVSNDTTGEPDNWFWGVGFNNGNSLSSVDGGASWTAAGHQQDFRLSVIPEPSTLGIAGLLAVGYVLRRRRRDANTNPTFKATKS